MRGHDVVQLLFKGGLVNGLRMVGVGVGRGHILPHEQAHFVRPVVPAGGFHFDVLAHHVEAERFHRLDVGFDGGFGGRRVDAVRPKSLIQRADFKDEFVVEHHLLEAADLRQRDFTHSEVAGYAVRLRFALRQRHLHIVEEGAVRRPQAGIREGKGEFRIGLGRERFAPRGPLP